MELCHVSNNRNKVRGTLAMRKTLFNQRAAHLIAMSAIIVATQPPTSTTTYACSTYTGNVSAT